MTAAERDVRAMNLHLLDAFGCAPDSGMPNLEPSHARPQSLVSFLDALANSHADTNTGVHFFIDDYRFERVWREPMRYVNALRGYGCVLAPDFSTLLDMPEPMQRWNAYRSRAVSAIWQQAGLDVVPVLTWTDEGGLDFLLEGIPSGGTVALSTVGMLGEPDAEEDFINGASACCEIVRPSLVLAYGRPREFDSYGAEVIWYASSIQERFERMRQDRKNEAAVTYTT